MAQRNAVQWIVPVVFGIGTLIFYWDVRNAPEIDVVLIRPLLIVMAGLWLAVIVKQLRFQIASRTVAERMSGSGTETTQPAQGRRALLFLAAIVAYLIAMNTIGFFVSSLLFLLASLWLLGYRRPILLVAIPGGLVAVIYIIFVRVLGVPFPQSLVGLF